LFKIVMRRLRAARGQGRSEDLRGVGRLLERAKDAQAARKSREKLGRANGLRNLQKNFSWVAEKCVGVQGLTRLSAILTGT
jgi:hypothetical protein